MTYQQIDLKCLALSTLHQAAVEKIRQALQDGLFASRGEAKKHRYSQKMVASKGNQTYENNPQVVEAASND